MPSLTTRLHLIVGPVGAGKSTFGEKLAREHRAVRLTLDQWMSELYGLDERPSVGRTEWYVERTERCLRVLEPIAFRLADVSTNVVLEIGLIRRAAREAFYRRADDAGHALAIYALDAPRDVRRERVERRNRERGPTFSMEVPLPFFEFASDLWEAPDEEERARRGIACVDTGTSA